MQKGFFYQPTNKEFVEIIWKINDQTSNCFDFGLITNHNLNDNELISESMQL